jgi:hypothetical protein
VTQRPEIGEWLFVSRADQFNPYKGQPEPSLHSFWFNENGYVYPHKHHSWFARWWWLPELSAVVVCIEGEFTWTQQTEATEAYLSYLARSIAS